MKFRELGTHVVDGFPGKLEDISLLAGVVFSRNISLDVGPHEFYRIEEAVLSRKSKHYDLLETHTGAVWHPLQQLIYLKCIKLFKIAIKQILSAY